MGVQAEIVGLNCFRHFRSSGELYSLAEISERRIFKDVTLEETREGSEAFEMAGS